MMKFVLWLCKCALAGLALAAIIVLADNIPSLPKVSWAAFSAAVAVASLGAILVRAYRKKGYGFIDTVLGVAYLAFVVKFCQAAWGLSWLATVGAGVAGLVVAYLGYVAFLFIYVK